MKQLLRFCVQISFAFTCFSTTAQTTSFPRPTGVPQGTQGKPNLPTPKIAQLKPDLQFVSANVVAVEELASQHLIRIKLSITYKNAGAADADRDFSLDLQGFYGTTGGTTHAQIGSNCTLHPLAGGQSRTEEWWFLKDVTALGRGHHPCMVRIDCTDRIAESDETNNNSPQFDINVP